MLSNSCMDINPEFQEQIQPNPNLIINPAPRNQNPNFLF